MVIAIDNAAGDIIFATGGISNDRVRIDNAGRMTIGGNTSLSYARLRLAGYSDTVPLQEWGDNSGAVYTRIGRTVGNVMYMDNANYGSNFFEFRGYYSFTTSSGFKIPNGAGSGKVLTSDTNGVGTWQNATATFNGVLCTGTYSVTTSLTAVTFTTESYDTDAFHDNATNTSRLTVPSVALAGKYRIT